MKETLIERMQQLIDRANKLRMKSVALPVRDLEELVRRCDAESAERLVLVPKGRPEPADDHSLEEPVRRPYTLWR